MVDKAGYFPQNFRRKKKKSVLYKVQLIDLKY